MPFTRNGATNMPAQTNAQRQARRLALLNEAATTAGWAGWRQYETAIIHNEAPMTTKLTDAQLARKLNESAHMGGQMTDYGVWYAENAMPNCQTYPLGARDWTAADVREYRKTSESLNA